MKRVTQLRIKYGVVTPAFLGGSHPRHAELRPPSIKAALRFWYRAVDPDFSRPQPASAPIRESLLFGAAENSDDARQHRDRGAVLPKVGSMQVQS